VIYQERTPFKIVLFGLNREAREFLSTARVLELIGLLKVTAILDNDSRITGGDERGIPIRCPKEVVDLEFDIILVAPIFFQHIRDQLVTLGVEKSCIVPLNQSFEFRFSDRDRSQDGVNLGKYSYLKPSARAFNCDIGRFVQPGDNCVIGMIGHDPSCVTTYPLHYHFTASKPDLSELAATQRTSGRTKIGHNAYLGEDSIIMGGVTVGDGAVIAARAVVTKDIPSYCIAAGVPARVIRKRFSEEAIEALLKIKWWNWSDEKIEAEIDSFSLPVEEFVHKHLS